MKNIKRHSGVSQRRAATDRVFRDAAALRFVTCSETTLLPKRKRETPHTQE
jgi:hypothetical protein